MNELLARTPGRTTETRIDDEIVVMDLDTGNFFSLTGSAMAAWQLIDGTRDRPALVAALAAQFATTPGDIAGEVDAFLAELAAAGLIAGA